MDFIRQAVNPRILNEYRPTGATEMNWQPIEELDKSSFQNVLVYDDGAIRTLIWNPRGYWEHPHPMGTIADWAPTHFMELPEPPEE